MAEKADCLFCRIAAGEISAEPVHEDDDVVAFRDIDPQAPTHVLIIPRRHISSVNAVDEEDAGVMGRLFVAAREVARAEGVAESGYRLIMNTGPDAQQSVDHVHLHLIGGRGMSWPPG